jgi:thiamine-phosphate pyrophosphorylase
MAWEEVSLSTDTNGLHSSRASTANAATLPGLDLSLYVILDPEQCGEQSLVSVACQSAEGGARLFQLRDKRGHTRQTIGLARDLLASLNPYGAVLLINDRVDIALAAGAHGVHLGQEDMAPEDARRLLPADAVIGLTVRSLAEADAAPLELLDYVSIGGVFPTGSKQQTKAHIGLDGLNAISSRLRERGAHALCAISGIGADKVPDVVRAGVDGVAVISAVISAADPKAAAHDLKARVLAALKG